MTTFQDNKVLALPPPIVRAPHIQTLLEMLTYRRPDGSKTERKFIRRYLTPLAMTVDKAGNLHKRIGDAPILWSCHTDTVHKAGGRQHIKTQGGHVVVADRNSNCLGADCTVGVWIMSEMIKAGIPGLYIFHRAEECGGVGSDWISKNTPEVLADIKYAIAFDRRGSSSVITHQWCGRCCSDKFATSLADAIGMNHIHDSGGSFTDTASYVDIVGECTNLSVGYKDEHTKSEALNIDYVERLYDAVMQADFTGLVAERKAGDVEYDGWEDWGYGRSSYTSSRYGNYTSAYGGRTYTPSQRESRGFYDEDQAPDGFKRTTRTMYQLVRDHPEEVADWLEEYGLSTDELAMAIYMRGGAVGVT